MIPLQLVNLATRYQLPSGATIEMRGEGKWCILDGGVVLDSNGNWIWEPQPSNRTDEFIAATRFTLDEAYERAKAVGLTVGKPTGAPRFAGVSSFGFGVVHGRSIEVVSRGDGKWVVRRGDADYNGHGEWEISVRSDDPAFLERTGYTWEQAMAIALGLAPKGD